VFYSLSFYTSPHEKERAFLYLERGEQWKKKRRTANSSILVKGKGEKKRNFLYTSRAGEKGKGKKADCTHFSF